MTTVVRHCTQCGRDDMSHQWSSVQAAADDGALGSGWACPSCGMPDPELVEIGAEAPDQASAAAPDQFAPTAAATVEEEPVDDELPHFPTAGI